MSSIAVVTTIDSLDEARTMARERVATNSGG
jgi:hypothetical protein